MQSERAIRLKKKCIIQENNGEGREREREREGERELQQFYRLVMIAFDYIVAHGVLAETRGWGGRGAKSQ